MYMYIDIYFFQVEYSFMNTKHKRQK